VRVTADFALEKSPQWGDIIQYGHSLNSSSGGKYFYKEDLRRLVWAATKENKEEIPIPEASFTKHNCSVNVTALVDLKESWLYAFKIVLSTPSSSAIDYFVIP